MERSGHNIALFFILFLVVANLLIFFSLMNDNEPNAANPHRRILGSVVLLSFLDAMVFISLLMSQSPVFVCVLLGLIQGVVCYFFLVAFMVLAFVGFYTPFSVDEMFSMTGVLYATSVSIPIVIRCMRSFGKSPSLDPVNVNLLRHEQWGVRYYALDVVLDRLANDEDIGGQHTRNSLVPILVELLDDEHEPIREGAVKALGYLGNTQAVS